MDTDHVMTIVHTRFAMAEPGLPNGFAEHTTMGAEAMLRLAVPAETVLAWADRHEPQPDVAPTESTLGSLRAELERDDWPVVLRRHATALVDRLDAHLFHGLIRTAHAVRSLEYHDDDAGRSELAAGLAAWARWAPERAPGSPPGATVDVAPDPLTAIADAARRGAGAYLGGPSIFNLHAVTAPMAYHLIAHHLDDEAHRVAATVFERTHPRHPPPPPGRTTERSGADVIASVARHWDAHPAKLVEAALRAHLLTGDDVFLDVVASVLPQ